MLAFVLKHKNDEAAVLQLHEETGEILRVKVLNGALMPYLGKASERDMKKWWKMRGMPKSRADLQDILEREKCGTSELFLMKNLGLSLTDTYWICPLNAVNLTWETVNLFDRHDGRIRFRSENTAHPEETVFTKNPNASLNASSVAYWKYRGGNWYLFKEDETHDGQQSANELFACEIHRRQGMSAYTEYQRFYDEEKGKTGSVCAAFTSEKRELISAYEVANSAKRENSVSEYEHYISVCVSCGLSEESVRNFLDYQTLTDFLITNTDRHYLNFGLLRDSGSMEILSAAPIYDSGNSMFFRDIYRGTRASLPGTEITGIAKTEEKMLRFVKNVRALDLSATPDEKEVADFYEKHGIDERKAGIIAHNYGIKKSLLSDLQRGAALSVYMEKQRGGA